jgi:N-carbamoylputrescine amidase
MGGRQEAVVNIACIQMEPVVGDKASNVARSVALIEEAAGRGARLIVLPELCNSGYVFESRDEAFELAEPVPDGPTIQAWSEVAARHGLHLVAGISEQAADTLYNSAVLIGPHGYIGSFRKVHLWNEENLYFEPGDVGFPVFKTPIGRIGMFICYDCWFPESFRLCALQGADIVCVPTNWGPSRARIQSEKRWRTSSAWRRRTATRSSSRRRIASAPSAARISSARA